MPRMDVAVATSDGTRLIVNAGRPGDLIAFADKFRKIGPDGPDTIRELAWLTWHTLGIEQDFLLWMKTLEELTPDPEEVERLRAEWKLDADPTKPSTQTDTSDNIDDEGSVPQNERVPLTTTAILGDSSSHE